MSESENKKRSSSWFHRLVAGFVVGGLFLGGGGYAWTFTPSYSLYRIKQALEAHNYELFSRYVDVDSVLDHALDELGEMKTDKREEPPLRGFLGKLLRKNVFKLLSGETRDITKAGLSMVVEQTVRDRDRPLPQIPFAAVAAALWLGHTEGDVGVLPVKVKKDKVVTIKVQRAPAGPWRVVEVSNLQVFLPMLQRYIGKNHPDSE